MMNYRTVVSVSDVVPQKALEWAVQYDMVELRTDLLDWTHLDYQNVLMSGGEYILKLAPDTICLLDQLGDCLPTFIDLDVEMDRSRLRTIIDNHPESRLILSYHNYKQFEDPKEVFSRYEGLIPEGSIFKCACYVSSHQEAKTMMGFYALRPNSILIGMGGHGLATRLMGLELGAPLTYVYPDGHTSTASGQLTTSRFKSLFETTAICGVLGDPISHSLSPVIFNTFLREWGINRSYHRLVLKDMSYGKLLVETLPLDFLNVTAPFKKLGLSGDPIENPMNLRICDGSKIKLFNTDTLAIQNILESLHSNIEKVLIVGNGGAAWSAAQHVSSLYDVTFCNRSNITTDGCQQLPWPALEATISEYDCVIWTIPAKVAIEREITFDSKQVVIDANYKNNLKNAGLISSETVYYDGLHWLTHQALPVMKGHFGVDLDADSVLHWLANYTCNKKEKVLIYTDHCEFATDLILQLELRGLKASYSTEITEVSREDFTILLLDKFLNHSLSKGVGFNLSIFTAGFSVSELADRILKEMDYLAS